MSTFTARIFAAPKPEDSAKPESKRESQATRIVSLALDAGVEPWSDEQRTPYLTVPVETHLEHYVLESRSVRDYLDHLYYRAEGRCAGSEALKAARETLSGLARFEGKTYPARLRVADTGRTIYIDLADAQWRHVEVSADGWRLVTSAPVRFIRAQTTGPLPVPIPGGKLTKLRELLNLEDDRGWQFVVAWILQALRGRGPYPILTFPCEQGTGKTTAARIIANTCDPDAAHPLGPPKQPGDLISAAKHRYVLALDNISSVQDWLSDMLCRLSTGGAYAARTLYTNSDEHVLAVQRPVSVNGIGSFITRPDLLDRALVVRLPVIDDEARITEEALLAKHRDALPEILGGLLDVMVRALRHEVHPEKLPRLADHAVWIMSAEPALEWKVGSYLAALFDARMTANVELLEADLLGTAIRAFMEHLAPGEAGTRTWTGTSSELLTELTRRASDDTKKAKVWPQTPEAVASQLERLAPALRRVGIEVVREARTGRTRPWTLTLSPEDGKQPSQPSQPSPTSPADDGYDGYDGSFRPLRVAPARPEADPALDFLDSQEVDQ